MTGRATLLEHADQILDGRVALGSRSTRVAALLARGAFEEWLDEQCPWASAARRPSTKSKLAVLDALDGEADTGERAKRIWHALSRICHHHAYELQASPAEVRPRVARRSSEPSADLGAESHPSRARRQVCKCPPLSESGRPVGSRLPGMTQIWALCPIAAPGS